MKRYIFFLSMLLIPVCILQHSALAFASEDGIAAASLQPDKGRTGNTFERHLKLFPNPIITDLNIVNSYIAIERLVVSNVITGEQVFASPIPIPSEACITINMAACEPGYYVVRAWYKDKTTETYSVYKK